MTHVRYGHASRPREMDVVCPGCGGRARASKASERHHAAVVADIDGTWRIPDWSTSCPSCPHRATNLSHDSLPPLFWRLSVRGIEVWAWNREHLAFLAAYLANERVDDHPYHWFAAYVPGAWKRDGANVARKIRDTLL